MRHALLTLILLAGPSAARAETWLIYPVRAEHPPPRDPTLLRMSVELARAVNGAVEGHVQLAKREDRDSACPLACPPEVASLEDVDHVIELVLGPALDELKVRLFSRTGRIQEGKVPCKYDAGAVTCDADRLERMLAGRRPEAPLDPRAVKKAFSTLSEALARCGAPAAGVDASVRFRVRPDGRVTDVRITPKEVQSKAPYPCMARVVESLRVPPFAGAGPVAFSMRLPP